VQSFGRKIGLDICEGRALMSFHHLVQFLLLFLKSENLTEGDGVKTRGNRLLHFEITGAKIINLKNRG
jgi:hypothetical protein